MTVTENSTTAATRGGTDQPYIIIAADSHAGLPTARYREYLKKKYWPQLDEFLAQQIGRAHV